MTRTRETLFTITDRDGDSLTLDRFTGNNTPTTHYLSVHSDTFGIQPVQLQPAQLEDLGNHLLSHGNRIAPRHPSGVPHTSWTHTDLEDDMLAVELLDRVKDDPYHEVYITAMGTHSKGQPVTAYLDLASLLEAGLHLVSAAQEATKAADNG